MSLDRQSDRSFARVGLGGTRNGRWAGGLIVLLLAGFAAALRATANDATADRRFYDAKMYFVAGLLYRQGADPYDPALEGTASATFAGDGRAVGMPGEQTFINLPAMLPVSAVLSYAGWPGFAYLVTAANVVCLVGCGVACVSLTSPTGMGRPCVHLSLAAAMLPATWQTISLGQIGLPIVLAGVVVIGSLKGDRNGPLFAGVLVVLLKVTMALPFVAFALAFGTRRNRLAVAGAVAVFGAMNLVAAQPMGLLRTAREFRANTAAVFAGGVDDPDGTGRLARIDGRPLWSLLTTRARVADVGNEALFALLGLAALARLHRANGPHLAAAAALLAMGSAYHRQYDAVLLIPVLWWAADLYLRRSYLLSMTVIALVGVQVVSFGAHGPLALLCDHFRTANPWWLPQCAALATTVLAVAVVGPVRNVVPSQAGSKAHALSEAVQPG